MSKVFILLSVILFTTRQSDQTHFLADDYIDQINNEATTWKAGKNFPSDTPVEYIKSMLGSKGVGKLSNGPLKTEDSNYINFGSVYEFDARKYWRHCQTIGHVRDQGMCGSSWAIATTSAFSDRLCIATDRKFNQLISAEKLTFCCYFCGFGCFGGWPIMAWRYFKYFGIVTGGDYGSNEGCQPYKVQPCSVDETGNNTCSAAHIEKPHRCRRKCYGNTTIDYHNDHFYTRDAYHLTAAMIQKDVMAYGPVVASIDVYDDFMSYESGVYVKTENATYLGGHSVKLIGWGYDWDVPYWLMVNSWNLDWGDKGIFKIRRNTNECRIEDSVTGGVPFT
ncbi:cathepsin B-like cysteine proteinase 3 [Adelges cooleyi]|uniref:cathepsin B-like cysteine proteinase 3 n=1 Tax=Adelges cooleyi TaxID=133065 RepID=UPI00217FBD8D|nr:cathepsin B-like cysteine proteinase 3 [Adelges cooleyi]